MLMSDQEKRYDPTDKVKLLRFRAWLECGDWAEQGGEYVWKSVKPEVKIPITSCEISVNLNAVPIASVTVATGRKLSSSKDSLAAPEISPIHNAEYAKRLLSMPNMQSVRIFFRPLPSNTDEKHVIFDGFVWQPAQSFTYSNTEITLTLVFCLF
jgi:hypothetical protein